MNWSYSKLSRYEKCPASYNFRYNLRIADPPGKAAQRGTDTHAIGEAFIKNEIQALPETIHHADFISSLKTPKTYAERALYFNDKWEPCEKEGYWSTVVIDVLVDRDNHVEVWDFKTGKFYDSHYDQLMLYSLASLILYPKAEQALSGAIYLDQPQLMPVSRTTVRDQVPSLKEYYESRVAVMAQDKTFEPNPGKHCSWCAYSKKKGGLCRY